MNKKGGRAWVRGVCAPAVVTGIYKQDGAVSPDVTSGSELLNFFVFGRRSSCLMQGKDKSGRVWVIGVCAPAVVTGIYKEDALVFPDVTCPTDSELKFFIDSAGEST